MTDPTTPVPDPVEDLVRRTFAVRAEDMAPGDGADEPPLSRAGRRPGRAPGRAVLAAALVIVVTALAATVAIVASDGDRDDTSGRLAAGSAGSQPAMVFASESLVVAVQDERNLAAITLIGQDDLVDVPVDDTAQARLNTDTAVDEFTDSVDASPDAALYQPAIDALGVLDQVRGQVDAITGPRDMSNLDASQEIFERYTEIVRGVLDGQRAAIETIEDPAVRLGASAYLQGLELADLTATLARAAIMAGVSPGPDASAGLAAASAEMQQGLDQLVEETAGTPYEDAAATVVADFEASGLLEAAGAVPGGTVDIAGVLAAVNLPDGQGWSAYLDRVRAIIAEG